VTQNATPGWISLLGLGATSALIFVSGLALGWLADKPLHTFPILTFVGLVLGIAGAGRYAYLEIRKYFYS
jgi:Putative F0F1-ATPase subunit Ca2+/Mg2+ transporter